jgi:hypothetical protein
MKSLDRGEDDLMKTENVTAGIFMNLSLRSLL